MKKIIIDEWVIKVHNVPERAQHKSMSVIRQYLKGDIQARKLGNGKFKVLDIDREFRVVQDNNNLHIMSHQCYNKFIKR